jgi:hypothetical protein
MSVSFLAQDFVPQSPQNVELKGLMEMIVELRGQMESLIGTILPFGGSGSPPAGFLLCNGSHVAVAEYVAHETFRKNKV